MIGRHWLVEYYECDEALLASCELVEQALRAAVDEMSATYVTSKFHHFSPLGVSGVIVIAESHVTIHTWPEHGYAAVDIFTCGEMDSQKGIDFLKAQLSSKRVAQEFLERGKEL